MSAATIKTETETHLERCERCSALTEDGEGETVRQLAVAKSAGLHRVVWDLRTGEGGRDGRRRRSGPLVAPGEYKVTLMKISGDEMTALDQPRTVLVKSMNP